MGSLVLGGMPPSPRGPTNYRTTRRVPPLAPPDAEAADGASLEAFRAQRMAHLDPIAVEGPAQRRAALRVLLGHPRAAMLTFLFRDGGTTVAVERVDPCPRFRVRGRLLALLRGTCDDVSAPLPLETDAAGLSRLHARAWRGVLAALRPRKGTAEHDELAAVVPKPPLTWKEVSRDAPKKAASRAPTDDWAAALAAVRARVPAVRGPEPEAPLAAAETLADLWRVGAEGLGVPEALPVGLGLAASARQVQALGVLAARGDPFAQVRAAVAPAYRVIEGLVPVVLDESVSLAEYADAAGPKWRHSLGACACEGSLEESFHAWRAMVLDDAHEHLDAPQPPTPMRAMGREHARTLAAVHALRAELRGAASAEPPPSLTGKRRRSASL